MNDLSQLSRQREALSQELARIRRASLDASARGDFRAVARLTLEAARINRAILDSQAQADAAR